MHTIGGLDTHVEGQLVMGERRVHREGEISVKPHTEILPEVGPTTLDPAIFS